MSDQLREFLSYERTAEEFRLISQSIQLRTGELSSYKVSNDLEIKVADNKNDPLDLKVSNDLNIKVPDNKNDLLNLKIIEDHNDLNWQAAGNSICR